MDELDSQLIKAAEAVVIITALKELILRLESKRNKRNRIEIDAAISYCKLISRKYYKLSRTRMKRDLNGKLIPVTTSEN